MANTTSRADFDTRLDAGHRVVPVIRELFADGETPVGIYRKLAAGKPGTFLLESAEQGGIWSRFSFVDDSSAPSSSTPTSHPGLSRPSPTCTSAGAPRTSTAIRRSRAASSASSAGRRSARSKTSRTCRPPTSACPGRP
jgi:anthranilate/para-aminobenzoate synthase component I